MGGFSRILTAAMCACLSASCDTPVKADRPDEQKSPIKSKSPEEIPVAELGWAFVPGYDFGSGDDCTESTVPPSLCDWSYSHDVVVHAQILASRAVYDPCVRWNSETGEEEPIGVDDCHAVSPALEFDIAPVAVLAGHLPDYAASRMTVRVGGGGRNGWNAVLETRYPEQAVRWQGDIQYFQPGSYIVAPLFVITDQLFGLWTPVPRLGAETYVARPPCESPGFEGNGMAPDALMSAVSSCEASESSGALKAEIRAAREPRPGRYSGSMAAFCWSAPSFPAGCVADEECTHPDAPFCRDGACGL